MGFFFLCVCAVIVIMSDLDGVPQRYLWKHLKDPWVQFIYQVPEIAMIGGVIVLMAGSILDIEERVGCPFFTWASLPLPVLC